METIPAFYRGGNIIARRERPRRSTAAMANDPFTLVVALDSGGGAVGELYIDDGRSFAFKHGQYFHRVFTCKHLQLSSAMKHGVIDSADGAFQVGGLDSALTIERIIFLGLDAASRYSATLPDGSVIDLEAGPLNMRYPSTHAFVLARPNLVASSDWTVKLTKK
eukprot:gene2761-12632_t